MIYIIVVEKRVSTVSRLLDNRKDEAIFSHQSIEYLYPLKDIFALRFICIDFQHLSSNLIRFSWTFVKNDIFRKSHALSYAKIICLNDKFS